MRDDEGPERLLCNVTNVDGLPADLGETPLAGVGDTRRQQQVFGLSPTNRRRTAGFGKRGFAAHLTTGFILLGKNQRKCRRQGIFRRDLDPIELHMSISALCFFNVANRPTFSTIFKRDMASAKALAARRAQIVDIVVSYARAM